MPYKSEKQRRYMHAKHPEIARRWDKEGKGNVAGYKSTMPAKASKSAASKKKGAGFASKVSKPANRGNARKYTPTKRGK